MTRNLTLALLVVLLGGCNALEWPLYVLFGGQKTKVKAEYTGLQDARTAVVVVAGPAVEFDYPYARTSLGIWVAHTIQERVKHAEFVPQERIDNFQRENLDWYDYSVAELAETFAVERILYIDLITFSMQEEHSVNLLRGHIIGDIRVYDVQDASQLPVYQAEISAVYPEHGPVPLSDTASQQVPRLTMQLFAEELARKFYDHEVPRD